MAENKYKYRVFFDIEERGPEGKYKVLVDNYGYVCGIYGSYKDAKKAMKPIRRNMVKEFRRREGLGLSIPVEVSSD